MTTSTQAPTRIDQATLGELQFSKWRLPNGLEVILAPDAHAKAVAYTTWFRVGSRNENEPAGETGLAHLFEHLMFTQTASANDGDFDLRMEAAGGASNAMTDVDFTAYINVVPPTELDLAASLEADRMHNLALRPKQIETERQVVIEERLATVEDSVDGRLDELITAAAYRTHPYRWPVIGYMDHIKKVSQKAVQRFYKTHYAPNNAVIIVAGKFDPQAALDTVVQRYGALSPSPIQPPAAVTEQAPVAAHRDVIEWPVPADKFALALGAPALGHADRPAFDVLDAILSTGPSSRLNRAMVVDGEMASSADCQVGPTRENGLYVFWVQMRKGHNAAAGEAVIAKLIKELATKPVPADELARAKNKLQMDFWTGLAGSEGRAEQLGMYEIGSGSFKTLFSRAEQYERVTADDVMRVANTYLLSRPAVVAVATPTKTQ
ncbi:MAG: pitrilysin family protein [Deltaproteobacteria bacterium]|nr:pitrilysin family protein [Deltaproteobacteria bacterium]